VFGEWTMSWLAQGERAVAVLTRMAFLGLHFYGNRRFWRFRHGDLGSDGVSLGWDGHSLFECIL
jgi:hypothetical protein